MDFSDVIVFAGQYDRPGVARADFDGIPALHRDGLIGGFQAAVFEKRPDGKVKVIDTVSTTRATGARWGAVVGGALALMFPAGLLVGMAEGAAAGAFFGNEAKGWFGRDVKTIGQDLEPGEAGVIAIAESKAGIEADTILPHAIRTSRQEFDDVQAGTVRQELAAGR